MRSVIILPILLAMLKLSGFANQRAQNDTLTTILKSRSEKIDKQKQLTSLFYNRYLLSSVYDNDRKQVADSVKKYNSTISKESELLADIFILRRKFELKKAEQKLLEAIEVAQRDQEKYLLFVFNINLAYVHTDQNNSLAAIHNYRQAKKIAEDLADGQLIISADIGISDLFTTIGLYQQALMYLNEAQQQVENTINSKESSKPIIYLNKADVFFNLGQLDSLRYYQKLATQHGAGVYDLGRNLKRLEYYSLILQKKHRQAIVLIRQLIRTGNQYYKNTDRWNLAKSLYAANNLDSAVIEANEILSDERDGPSTIKLNAYKLIAKVADDQNDEIKAIYYYKLALEESEQFIIKMRSVDLLSTELRQDGADAAYHAQNLLYHKERVILFSSIAVTTLIIFIIYLLYRNVKQKSTYQRMLHDTRSQELAFINSHQVRKPLANMLAICRLLIDNENTEEENIIYYQLLDQQVQEMDQKLKEVEMKLREHH
jgi:hypothetical protein